MSTEPRHAVVGYPGGLRASWRWAGSGDGAKVFALTEAGGPLVDLGSVVSDDPDALCRAELRVELPAGPWTVRLASTISDEPAGLVWDTEGQLVVKYGFHAYGLERGAASSAGRTARRRRSWPCSGHRGCRTSWSRPSSRRSRSSPTGPSAGGWRIRTW